MGGKASAPASPDYASIIPLQEQSNINQFNTMLGASRVNSQTPYGNQYWIRPSAPSAGTQAPAPTAAPPPATSQPPAPTVAGPGGSFSGDSGSGYDTGQAPGGAPPPATGLMGGPEQGPFQGVPNIYGGGNQDPWTMVQQFSPEQQQLYDQDLRIRQGQGNISEGMLGNVAQTYGQPANFSGLLPQYQENAWGGPSYKTNMGSRDAAEQAIYNRQMRYAGPQMAEDKRAQQDRLTAMGFNINDPGSVKAMDQLNLAQERQRADMADRAILGGGQEATAELGRGIAAATPAFAAGTTNQNQALNYAMQNMAAQAQDRARQLNELNAFRTGQQVQAPGLPGQTSVPNLQGIDQLGLAGQDYQNRLAGVNAQNAGAGNFMNGLFGLGSAWLSGGGGNPFG